MNKKQYKRSVFKNRIYGFKYWFYDKIGWRLSLKEPELPPCIPRKPRKDEIYIDAVDWSGYYTWPEMRDIVIPVLSNNVKKKLYEIIYPNLLT